MMSSDVQSSCTKDTFETRSISKVTDDSSLSDESSMPSLGMEIETNAHFEQLQCAFEIPVVIEMACVDLDFTLAGSDHSCRVMQDGCIE
jgi:hypothetical protein